jgi:hypothetical protein
VEYILVIPEVEPFHEVIREDVYAPMKIDIVEIVVKGLYWDRVLVQHKYPADKKEALSHLAFQTDLIYKKD